MSDTAQADGLRRPGEIVLSACGAITSPAVSCIKEGKKEGRKEGKEGGREGGGDLQKNGADLMKGKREGQIGASTALAVAGPIPRRTAMLSIASLILGAPPPSAHLIPFAVA